MARRIEDGKKSMRKGKKEKAIVGQR